MAERLGLRVKQVPLIGTVDPQERRTFDYYPTPSWMTAALMRRVSVWDVVEPCAGDGAITKVLQKAGKRVLLTNDLDPSRETDLHLDTCQMAFWERVKALHCMWGITNVPFDLADVIVPMAVRALPYFATILRLSWLEPTAARQRFLVERPPARVIVLPRHDFKGRGSTDSVCSAWFIWEDGISSVRSKPIDIVTKDERDELIAMEKLAR